MYDRLPDVMTPDEWTAFCSVFRCRTNPTHLRDLAMFTLMHDCGLRCGEAIGLRVTDVRRTDAMIALDLRTTKGNRQRRVYLTEQAEDMLNSWQELKSVAGQAGPGGLTLRPRGRDPRGERVGPDRRGRRRG